MQSVGTLFKAFLAALWIGMGFCSAARCAPVVVPESSTAYAAIGGMSDDDGHCEAHCLERSVVAAQAAETVKDQRVVLAPPPVAALPARIGATAPRAPPLARASAGSGVSLKHLSTTRLLI